MITHRKLTSMFSSLIVIFSLTFSAFQPASVSAQGEDGIKRQVNAESGKVSFIGPEKGQVLSASTALGMFIRPQDPAMALAKRFGPEFGLKNPDQELSELKASRPEDGRVTVHYQQNYQGIPVLGGELIVNTNQNGDLYSMNGEVSPDLSLQTQPEVASEQARDTTLQAVAKWYQKTPADFIASKPELWIFDESLLQTSSRPPELVWRMEVTAVDNSLPVRELVLVNAQTGGVSLHFNQIDTAWKGLTKDNISSPLVSPICSIQNGSGFGNLLFRQYIQYNCGLSGYGVGAGDFNNDGRNDVALSVKDVVGFQHTLLIFLQDNNGNLAQPISYSLGRRSEYLEVGDFNNDGRDDVVTVDILDGTMSVFLQNSGGTLNNRITYNIFILPDSIAVGDINSDGLDDIVISPWGSGSIGIVVFTQKSDGTLNTMVSYPTVSSGYGDIAIGDINSDGLNDVVKMNGQGDTASTLVIHTQNSNHTLNTYTLYTCSTPCVGNGIEVGDITGDGKADIVMSYGTGYSSQIAIFAQDVNGNLQPSISYPSYDGPYPVEIADMNSDNLLDVIVLHSGWQRAGIYSQQNNGTLGTESLYSTPYNSGYFSQGVSIGDVNNDGLSDILVVDGQGLAILYRSSIPTGGSYRLTYTANNGSSLPGQLLCDETAPFCTDGTNPHADYAHWYAGEIWDLYHDQYARNSIDNNGMTIISTVNYGSGYANAFWSGIQMVYGDAYGYPLADDVVAHELTHGVTQYESNLFYYYQSGAINESFSDVFGEYYDQTNSLGTDTAGVKWLIGEDVAGSGALRSMSNPPAYGDPDKMTSANYYKDAWDNGGVHYNSGINNKAVYLMVDGGTFNGKTVTAIGANKTLAIYYEAQTNLLSSGADYSDLYYALQQACTDLIGQKGITSGDCVEVKDAIDAVEMNLQPSPNFNTDAPLCTVAGTAPINIFSDDLESGASNWTINNGAYTRWQYDSPYGTYAHSGTHFLYADDYPSVITDATATLAPVMIPANAYLHFAHAYDFEAYLPVTTYYDGGMIEYSANGGATWVDAGSLIDYNGYIGVLDANYGNPLANRSAFAGTSHGYISTRLNLAPLAGQSVSFRWRMGLDNSGFGGGWSLDDVRIYNCAGRIISGNVGTADVTLSYTDGIVKTTTSLADGSYSFQVSNNWSGTVNPTHACYTFNPVSRTYSNITTDQTAQNYISTIIPASGCANINVAIGGVSQGTYGLPAQQSQRVNYFGVNTGPVKVVSTNGVPIIAAIRESWWDGSTWSNFYQLMGLPASQVSDTYLFPAYNNVSLDEQLRFGNVGVASTTVTVTIAGVVRGTYVLAPNESARVNYAGLNSGPVVVKSSGGVPIIAAIRDSWWDGATWSSFAQTMGLPAGQVSDTYLFPAYNNVSLDEQLRFGVP